MKPYPIYRVIMVFLMLSFGVGKSSFAQDRQKAAEGFVSFITSANVYVKFTQTKGIEPGDTLYVAKEQGFVPALVVVSRSSVSCLCTPVSGYVPGPGDRIFSLQKENAGPAESVPENPGAPEKDVVQEVLSAAVSEPDRKTDFSGRFSLSSYSDFSGSAVADNHRFRYTLSTKATDVAKPGLSAESYIIFTHRLDHWNEVQENLFHALKIYNLAVKYQTKGDASLWAGRRINPRMANAGPVDGLQFEYEFRNLYAGLVAGFRPGYSDFGFNASLPQYGAYVGHRHKIKQADFQSSLAFLEQTNQGKTDRRFVYFQHSSTLLTKVNLFTSFELDLFRLDGGLPENTFSLTSFYLSTSYRVSRTLNLSGSYDNRKNVIYYETFRNFAEEVWQQASRQGIRLSASFRPVSDLVLTASAGSRFRKGDPRRANTLNGYGSYSGLPWPGATLSLSASWIQNSLLGGQIHGARLSKDFLQGKMNALLHYRWVDFHYRNSASGLRQHMGEIDFSRQIAQNLNLSVNLETTFQGQDIFHRLYLNLRKKF